MIHPKTGGIVGAALCLVLVGGASGAASLTPELQKGVRAGTFEVVLKKTESDPLSYEKPPPLDLIPYVIRSDAYWSIGTAFAIAADTYVSAAHVLAGVTGSQFGAPALRDSAGHTYPIDRILKFSADEDFVVFSISGAPAASPLPTTTERKIDDPVFAVGNALGEGIVVRDGLLTSETPEQQDGRWKWLRFSAAASPGNSGGPLLDTAGRVIGIVRAKSPNENLNYAVPIELVTKSGPYARIDVRYTVKLPNARASQVASIKSQFDLPLKWVDFSRKYLELLIQTAHKDQQTLLTSLSDAPFPKGKSTKLLAIVYDSAVPAFVQQDRNDEWDVIAANDTADQELPGHGLVSTGNSLGVNVFRLRRPNGATDVKFYQDPTAMMDLLLKGLKLTRPVGDQAIRVTSLGHPTETSIFEDDYGRHWQVSAWPLGFADSYVVCYALPTPEGDVGMTQVVPAAQRGMAREWSKFLADAFYTNIAGTLAQWRVFLVHPELRPKAFERLQLDVDPHQGMHYGSSRLKVQIPSDLLKLSAESELVLHMGYMMDGDRLVWDVGGIFVYADQKHETYVALDRHVKPRDDSARDILDGWMRMRSHGPGYNRVAGHDEDFKHYWIHDALSEASPTKPGIDPEASVLYDVSYSTDIDSFPMDLEENERRLVQATQILER